MRSKLELLLRILGAEQKQGFEDRAVEGGLALFISTLISSDVGVELPAYVKALRKYSDLAIASRGVVVSRAMNAIALQVEGSTGRACETGAGIGLGSPVTNLYRVGPQYEKLLAKLGINVCKDMLHHFPRRYLDRSTFTPVAEVQSGSAVNVVADVVDVQSRKSPQRRLMLTEALLKDKSGAIRAIWFNQPYVAQNLRNRQDVAFFGRAVWGEHGPELRAPEYELDLARSLHSGRQVPVYPSTGRLSQKLLRLWASQAVGSCATLVDEFLPQRILESADLLSLNQALEWIHRFKYSLRQKFVDQCCA